MLLYINLMPSTPSYKERKHIKWIAYNIFIIINWEASTPKMFEGRS